MERIKDAETELMLKDSGIDFRVFGPEHIENGALDQMLTAARLPVSVAGALMPDAHSGYGLPIGGVLATENAVIPYGVGVDIGCRMCLSVFDLNPAELTERESYFAREIIEATLFGSGGQFKSPSDHAVLSDKAFSELPLLQSLHSKAWKQLGSSGSGNHFVEFGMVIISAYDEVLGIPAGEYVGLLSHSGSRGLGATIANHYTKLAKEKRQLPLEAANLAWFNLDEEEGIEYWIAMNLAGDYASACHHIIHEKIAKQLGREPVKMVENHHNFAWKEKWQGRDVIVHRKGATPAGKDVLGIIPGSMTAPGFIVKGKGIEAAVNSASHGAGRKMSRTKALASVTYAQFKEELQRHGVKLLGGGLDESPFAYKDIETVMKSQQELVEVLGKFIPKIVKMDSAKHKFRGKKKNQIQGE
jgi:tRNA-splicing ligase RtcB (3'-phosphate/5'-hydroxy nucleic acid ligase)